MNENELSKLVLDKAFMVHSSLGPGLLESAYTECLQYELRNSGVWVEKEVPQPIEYKAVTLDHGYRIDLLVENKLVIEIKSVESLNEVHLAQVLTYLRLGNFRLGLLLNFNVKSLKQGIRRIIN